MKIRQLTHEDKILQKAETSVLVVCDNISSPANAGALIRLCDAFGVKQLVFCGNKINLDSNRLKRTARATEKNVAIFHDNNILNVLLKLKENGNKLVGLEITSNSKAIHDYLVPKNNTVLVLGSEKYGISKEALLLLDETLHITMFGKNSSMNVGHAAAIALYQMTKPHPHENGI